MKKVKCQFNWNKCGLCGKAIRSGEDCWEIQYKQMVNRWGAARYKKEYWHFRHFIFRDYSSACKEKMSCITGTRPEGSKCAKKLCVHFK